jgi:hypothetical protein
MIEYNDKTFSEIMNKEEALERAKHEDNAKAVHVSDSIEALTRRLEELKNGGPK